MAENSKIEWTDKTWNPIAGCTPISPGCTNCYAATMARRLEAMGQEKYRGTAERRGSVDVFTGVINPGDKDSIDAPLSWKKPKMVFVNSMSDLFHEKIGDAFIWQIFEVMRRAHWHTFQVLTKRADRLERWFQNIKESVDLGNIQWPLPNVWIGVSVEDQQRANERIPYLLRTPAAVRFLSCEPLLWPIDLSHFLPNTPIAECPNNLLPYYNVHFPLHWVIVGGESGPGARRCEVPWIRSIKKQCQSAGVPVFVKQLGAVVVDRNDAFGHGEPELWNIDANLDVLGVEHHINGHQENYQGADCRIRLRDKKGGDPAEWPEDLRVREFPVVNLTAESLNR